MIHFCQYLIGKSPAKRCIIHFCLSRKFLIRLCHDIRCAAHAFHAAGDVDLSPTSQDSVCSVHDRLKPKSRAVIQSITIAQEVFPRYRETSDFIREYIFPGGMLAPIPRFIADAAKAGLSAGEPYCFGIDYAETLKWWLQRVNAKVAKVKPLGFDEKFLQLWRFYLCYCEAGFRTGRTDVMQIELTREN